MDNQWLAAAIEAVEQNDMETARTLLKGYTAHHPDDAQGWLWLSRVTEQPKEKIAALKRALEIQPENVAALHELSALYNKTQPSSKATRNASARKAPFDSVRRVGGWTLFGLAASLLIIVLAATLPMFMGYRSLVVLSGSMEPAIGEGDVVIAQPVPSKNLQIGDVIVFAANPDSQVPIVHRIVKTREQDGVRYYNTRGDANRNEDFTEISLPPTAWRVVNALPKAGYVIVWATRPIGALVLIAIPLVLLIVLSIFDWLKKNRRLQPAYAFISKRS